MRPSRRNAVMNGESIFNNLPRGGAGSGRPQAPQKMKRRTLRSCARPPHFGCAQPVPPAPARSRPGGNVHGFAPPCAASRPGRPWPAARGWTQPKWNFAPLAQWIKSTGSRSRGPEVRVLHEAPFFQRFKHTQRKEPPCANIPCAPCQRVRGARWFKPSRAVSPAWRKRCAAIPRPTCATSISACANRGSGRAQERNVHKTGELK
jgi:hypothetical protein